MLDKWLAGDYYRRNPAWAIHGDDSAAEHRRKLHMGHAPDDTIQDTIIRMKSHARRLHPLDLGHRPCGHRHADEGDKSSRPRESPAARDRPRQKFVDACWD